MTTTKKPAASNKKPTNEAFASTPAPSSSANPSEEALVLSYLRKHGLSDAASELSKILTQRKHDEAESEAKDESSNNKKRKLPEIDYDISDDAPDAEIKPSEPSASGSGYDVDSAPSVALWGVGCPSLKEKGGVRDEARAYVEGFTGLITWVLSLADDPANVVVGEGEGEEESQQEAVDVDGEEDNEEATNMEVEEENDENEQDADKEPAETAQEETNNKPHPGLLNLVQHAFSPNPPPTHLIPPSTSFNPNPLTPPTVKPELLSLTFPLMVHTYCELLSCNMENTAKSFLQTYRHIYEPSHPDAIADLDKCNSTSLLVELNEAVMNQNALQNEIRGLNSQIGSGTNKRNEMEATIKEMRERELSMGQNSEILQDQENNLGKIDGTLARLNQRLVELTAKNGQLQMKLSAFPFLRRVRALKWNVTISTSSYHALEGYASSRSESVVMTSLLMNRCHLIVERRDPLPFCPVAILDDVKDEGKSVNWAAPVHPAVRAMEAGEDVRGVDGNTPHGALARSILVHSEALPYPKYALDENDKDAAAKSAVEFNRALLVNGFRRLEALELKREYEAGVLQSEGTSRSDVADPLSPSVLLGSLCCSSEADLGAGAPWAESNVGITSASICPPDGRKVAVGCDDAAVRIWSLDRPVNKDDKNGSGNNSALGEPSMVLLGHKNGFPVFDVDWTRNGRTLLSAGGDGSIRLWDTDAVGPYGKLSNVSLQNSGVKSKINGPKSTTLSGPVDIPGSKAESMVEKGGAALTVYRGHAPSTPIWSVSSAPSGYYFASAGSDYTARIWSTDRCSPLRVLSGHISPSVNCVTWHPNCNYVLTASDDKTCRMWDIQTGNCVRILAGSSRGLNLVRVSPSGRYASAAGYDNIVRIWDLGSGRLVNELRPPDAQGASFSEGIIQAMSYSACGSALAVTGEDCTVRIWDVRGAASHLSNPDYFAAAKGPHATSSFSDGLNNAATATQLGRTPANEKLRPGTRVPTRVFRTNNISVLDLKYTKRNLLLAVGNYAA